MVLLNWFAFQAWLDTNYLRWYLDNGSVISLLFGLVTLAWGDLNKLTGLISADPFDYVAESMRLVGFPFIALAAMFESRREVSWDPFTSDKALLAKKGQLEEIAANPALPKDQRQAAIKLLGRISSVESSEPDEEASEPKDEPPKGLPVIDSLFAALFALTFGLASIAWLVIVAPLQYFVYLLTGTPAREACASPGRVWFKREGNLDQVGDTLKSDAVPEGAVESGFSARPVTFTAAITAGVLFAVSKLVS